MSLNNINYLDTTSDGRFKHDIKLGFNPSKLSEDETRHDWKAAKSIDGKDGEWFDGELDISDIPPTVFFLGIVNTYSSGFSLHVPTDMNLEKFSKSVCENFSKFEEVPWLYKFDQRLNVDYLNRTGRIQSVKEWNRLAAIDGDLWNINGVCIGSIQGIVANCRNFLTKKVG